MGSEVVPGKPHAVCIPYPAQGHITPMLKLAKLLQSKGFHITFVNNEFNHRRLLKSQGEAALSSSPDFRFEAIPDGLPPSDEDTTQDVPSMCRAAMTFCLGPFRELLSRLNHPDSALPPVSCVVSDVFMTFTLDAAKELGVPGVLLWTASACGLMGYIQYKHLVEKGLSPLKDVNDFTNGYLDTPIDWVPGLKNMRLRDFPSFIWTTDPNDIIVEYVIREIQRTSMASAIVVNTFDELESSVLSAMDATLLPPIYAVGPLSVLAAQIPSSPATAVGSNLWIEEPACLRWLEGKRPGTVVYVNFGSTTVMTNQQLVEFAWGLANSGHEFLWIIRPDLVKGDTAVLPPEFLDETKERSFLASWCPQEEVLSRPAIGGFLTHSGWNSTLESICSGVPMLPWPFYAEQKTNCRYVCTEWGMGMEIDSNVRREKVEELIRELMEGEKGLEMKRRAMAWRDGAAMAVAPGGPSYQNLEKVINEVLLSRRP